MRQAGATLRCGACASRCSGFSCCRAQALEHRLSSCGACAYWLRGMWDLPGPGIESVSPALTGGFLTTAPPGKSRLQCLGFNLQLPSRQKVATPAEFFLSALPGHGRHGPLFLPPLFRARQGQEPWLLATPLARGTAGGPLKQSGVWDKSRAVGTGIAP